MNPIVDLLEEIQAARQLGPMAAAARLGPLLDKLGEAVADLDMRLLAIEGRAAFGEGRADG